MGSDNHNVNLPPGFRFHPTDEELVVHFLHRKATLLPCHPDVIPDLHLYSPDPWELDGRALGEGNQWYFYSTSTQNQITENGYWKPLGIDEPVITVSSRETVGMKKYFIFYVGEAPSSGYKTNWIMHEYRLSDNYSANSSSTSTKSSKRRARPKSDTSKWVLCRVYQQDEDDDNSSGRGGGRGATELSCLDEVFLSLDDLDEISLPNHN